MIVVPLYAVVMQENHVGHNHDILEEHDVLQNNQICLLKSHETFL